MTLFCRIFLLIYVILLAGCGSNSGELTPETEAGAEVIYDPLLVAGTVAWGGVAAFAEVCGWNQLTEYCSRADRYGEYMLRDMTASNGILKSTFINGSGNEETLYSLFQLQNGDINTTSNINVITDLITQAYVSNTGFSPSQCYATPSCATDIQTSFDETRLENILAGIEILLGDLWPLEDGLPINPFSESYVAYPSNNPINTDGLIEMLTFLVDAAGLLTISDLVGAIASIPISQLATTIDPTLDDTVDATEASTTLAQFNFGSFVPESSPVSVIVTVSSNNFLSNWESPVNTSFTVNASPPLSDSILSWTAELYGPDDSFYTWTDLDATFGVYDLTLTAPGTWNFSAIATTASGLNGTDGRTFEIGIGLNSSVNATWGNSGRCVPNWSVFDQNSLNICLEQLDGGTLEMVSECSDSNEYVADIGRCSLFVQFDSAVQPQTPAEQLAENALRDSSYFLGHCSSMENEIRYYQYVNPLTVTGETLEESRSRVAGQCITIGGEWE